MSSSMLTTSCLLWAASAACCSLPEDAHPAVSNMVTVLPATGSPSAMYICYIHVANRLLDLGSKPSWDAPRSKAR